MQKLLAIALSCVLSTPCLAGFQFEIEGLDSGLAANSTVTQNVYLITNNIGGASTLNGSNFIEFNLQAGVGGTTIGSFTPNSAFMGNPFLPGYTTSAPVAGNTASVRLYNMADVAPVVPNRLLLGSVTLNTGAPGSTTALTFVDPGTVNVVPGSTGDNVLINQASQIIDNQVFSGPVNSQAAVVAVPEPSSLGLLGLGIFGATLRRRRS